MAADDTRFACIFHCNLAYSSMEREQHAQIVERCYWPMLRLASDAGIPIGVELTGWTLSELCALAPDWVERFRELIGDGLVELIGSAWTQCAAPLLPAEVNSWNLRLGREAYASILGVSPRIALVSEQAYSPGLVPLFAEAGYEAVIADWDNAYRSHPEWPDSHRRFPQRAAGDNASLPVIWSQSIAFQKFQRVAHGELPLDEYIEYVTAATAGGGVLLLYANDAEIFDLRPGRFAAEPRLELGEWGRIRSAVEAIRAAEIGELAAPSALLDALGRTEGGNELVLESADHPIPTKKQEKYNVARWATTGRDDIGINTRCWRLYRELQRSAPDDSDAWRELCYLWSSDFRTHITSARWDEYAERLAAAEARWPATAESPRSWARSSASVQSNGDYVSLSAGPLRATLNVRRGLAIRDLIDVEVSDRALVGTIPHGYFQTIDLGADWYTGTLVQEAPLRHKVTDLGLATYEHLVDGAGRVCLRASIETELGPVEKSVSLDGESRTIEIEYVLRWPELPLGSLRGGYITLLPDAFDRASLWYAAQNGGRSLDRLEIGDAAFDHGAPVSQLVSSREGIGATEGLLLVGDSDRHVRIEIDQDVAKPLALISYRPSVPSYLLRACFSLTEQDETRVGPIPRPDADPQRLRIRIGLRRSDEAV